MAESTTKTVLGEISQGHLECPICFCRFKEPKILDCLHSFCLNCLDGMLSAKQPDTSKISCPVCRKETPVPVVGLHGLLDCFFLSSLVDEFNQREQSLETLQSAIAPTCGDCEEGLEAMSRCLDCETNLCQLCKAAHERSKRTKKHQIIAIDSPITKQVTKEDLGGKHSPKCHKHGNQDMHFYCETCEVLTCAICAAIDHRSAEHKYSEIADAVRLHRKEVEDVLQRFERNREEFIAIGKSVDHARNRLQLMVVRACNDIQAKEEEEIAKIKNKSQILRDKITETGKKRDEEFETVHTQNKNKMERAETIVAAVTELMQQANDLELLNLRPKVMHNLDFQKELTFEKVNHDKSFIGVSCQAIVQDKSLGKILHREKWKLKTEFGKRGDGNGELNSARGVGCFSNSEIIVCDRRNERISVFTSEGHFKSKLDVKAPFGFAVSPDGRLLVNCKDHVKILGASHQLISQFTFSLDDPEEDNRVAFITGGIAAVDNKRVAVMHKGRTVTSLHNLDGSLDTVIPHGGMVPEDIATNTKGQLVFTRYGKSRLSCVDTTGVEVFNVQCTSANGDTAKPVGVCCDGAGDIYVTLHCGNFTGSGEIHHYDPHGVHIACVAKGLYWPFGIAISPRRELVVADQNSIKIFQTI
ncbi:tripartite motif-containing protein 3-like [Acanthaster planci]|uniref:Tripartite motif-containing protein 3-like n=1 Tax=Acanthaster planci TaxID=133434 RepID=A0A8B7ZFS8_ACAPL|nr:tripartite motif-containing protein 3-like [Acanthaster planci]XP_022104505.1 tripartite motif-containing protein 3-like [Acanthaster planci]XP_022104507.1 tripartite motif-containing protein 3-like [Acanthaster planci]XP_022104508.1 tripartite motif-containing protein 3-like [Acanthaster planci]